VDVHPEIKEGASLVPFGEDSPIKSEVRRVVGSWWKQKAAGVWVLFQRSA
jgi:hypothetical protein